MADHHSLDQTLTAIGAERSAAETHGMLAGMLCGPEPGDQARWVAEVLSGTKPRGETARECLAALASLHAELTRSLDDDTMGLVPLLPADEAPMAERAAELGRWCDGFLLGLGLGGLTDRRRLDRESQEILNDFAQIARVDPEDGGGEEHEQAYTELVEYVRVGALLIREHMTPSKPRGGNTAGRG
jgi:yecA family protein